MHQTLARGAAIAALAVMTAGTAIAQESSNRVAVERDWSVFVENSPKQCWGVSSPVTTANTRNGKKVDVERGDILLFVTFRPGLKAGEISFMGGYPFAAGSSVTMSVDGKNSFTLFTDGNRAWSNSPEADAKIAAAMRAGSDVTLTGHSSRGTKTQDKFSLMGFTAAIAEAQNRCSAN